MNGPFAAVAHDLRRRGLAVIPCPEGKSPKGAYAFGRWSFAPGEDLVDLMIRDHANANAAIITGLSLRKLTVIDVDDPGEELQVEMVRRCGDTPLATMTPSGGLHLYYRHSGERSTNLRRPEGIPVEVKTAASKMLVLVPPSFNHKTGAPYRFVEGTWDDLDHLPAVNAGAVPMLAQSRPATDHGVVVEGIRDDSLFRYVKDHAHLCDTFQDMLATARAFNRDRCVPPNDDDRVLLTAQSVWGYKERGLIFKRGGEAHLFLSSLDIEALDAFDNNGDAVRLLSQLIIDHSASNRPFPVSPRSMARDGSIPRWTEYRYRKAREVLVEAGPLVMVRKGGSREGDASLFRLRRRPLG